MGLEGFMDWVDPNASNPAKEMEDNMSSLATRFSTLMRKDGECLGGNYPSL